MKLKACAGMLAALLSMGLVSSASADETPEPIVHLLTNTEAATTLWSPADMRAATPLDGPLRTVENVVDEVAGGLPELIPGLLPSSATAGEAWNGEGKVTATAGRVFFVFNGKKASCSGNAVTSGNKSVVITAGHCVKLEGSWHTDWVFVPAYHDGNAPYGQWPARATLTTPQWEASEDLDYDVGAAVVSPVNGQYLTDVVGAQGIAFNQPRAQEMYGFGYPAEEPFDGSTLIYCAGGTFKDVIISSDNALRCDMTGGSSGGPWFIDFDPATGVGVQNSVTSFHYGILPGVLFGPYFGTDAQKLYERASSY